ncbi:MAG: outer membrane lipoprotein-sorting protein, partial [Gammaproteobacteria bacterium]
MKKTVRNRLTTALLSVGILTATNGAIAAPTADEIVNRTNYVAYYQGQDGKAKVKMTITDEQGRERSRQFVILRTDEPQTDSLENNAYKGDQKMYVYFSRPADVNKMVFMV